MVLFVWAGELGWRVKSVLYFLEELVLLLLFPVLIPAL